MQNDEEIEFVSRASLAFAAYSVFVLCFTFGLILSYLPDTKNDSRTTAEYEAFKKSVETREKVEEETLEAALNRAMIECDKGDEIRLCVKDVSSGVKKRFVDRKNEYCFHACFEDGTDHVRLKLRR